jgi:hypothetical protein
MVPEVFYSLTALDKYTHIMTQAAFRRSSRSTNSACLARIGDNHGNLRFNKDLR